MIPQINFSLRQPWWILLVFLVGTLGLLGCTKRSTLEDKGNITDLDKTGTKEASEAPEPTPPPSIQEVKDAIASTKTLLDDQQEQVGNLLSLRGEVKQTLREFRDQDLTPMKATIQALQHQIGAWEGAAATNQTTMSSSITRLTQDLEQAKTRVGVYGDQVTALVDQIDQNNQQYDTLLTEFQNSLIGFKEMMSEHKMELMTEKKRAAQEEMRLTNQLKEQQQTLAKTSIKTKEILVLQKRLNQLHTYINQVRDKVTSDTTVLQAALKPEATDNLRELVASLEDRYQQLAQAPPSNSVLTEHLETLEQRLEQSENRLIETAKTLQDDIQKISLERKGDLPTSGTENLQALVLGLEERYQQLTQTPPVNQELTKHLQALEKRIEQSEKHYAQTVKALHEDIQELSAGMRSTLQNAGADKLREVVHSLEKRYQQLAQAPSSNQALTENLQALEQRVAQSEKHNAKTIQALQQDIQKVSSRMITLTQSLSAETMEALQHDIQEVSAGMLRLAQSINHLEQTKIPTNSIKAGSITTPESPR